MLTQRSERERRAHMIRCKFREVGDDLRGGHPLGGYVSDGWHCVERFKPERRTAAVTLLHRHPPGQRVEASPSQGGMVGLQQGGLDSIRVDAYSTSDLEEIPGQRAATLRG